MSYVSFDAREEARAVASCVRRTDHAKYRRVGMGLDVIGYADAQNCTSENLTDHALDRIASLATSMVRRRARKWKP